MPLPQIPQQGDAQKLAQVATGLKRTGGTYGPVVQRNPTGRPPGTTGTPAPRQSQEPQVPPEHLTLIDQLARSEAALQQAQQVASLPGAGEWAQLYLEMAQQARDNAAMALHQGTPNFEP